MVSPFYLMSIHMKVSDCNIYLGWYVWSENAFNCRGKVQLHAITFYWQLINQKQHQDKLLNKTLSLSSATMCHIQSLHAIYSRMKLFEKKNEEALMHNLLSCRININNSIQKLLSSSFGFWNTMCFCGTRVYHDLSRTVMHANRHIRR